MPVYEQICRVVVGSRPVDSSRSEEIGLYPQVVMIVMLMMERKKTPTSRQHQEYIHSRRRLCSPLTQAPSWPFAGSTANVRSATAATRPGSGLASPETGAVNIRGIMMNEAGPVCTRTGHQILRSVTALPQPMPRRKVRRGESRQRSSARP